MIASCEREGSADAAIQKERFQPINELLRSYPQIKAAGLNGTKAMNSFKKMESEIGPLPVERKQLPSTSPVPGKNVKSFEEKTMIWRNFFAHYMEIGD